MCPMQYTSKSLVPSPCSLSPSASVIKEADKNPTATVHRGVRRLGIGIWEPSNLGGGGGGVGVRSIQGGGLLAPQKYTLHKLVGV